ncbi:hypothetical protein IJD15_01190 [bacterium]|nr:hypothetical protein [bacterium]
MWYTEEIIEEINEEFMCVMSQYTECLDFMIKIKLKDSNAIEYLQQGYGRRISILKFCCKRIFEIFPPDRTELLKEDELDELDIFIQSFFVNIYGIIDNLLWIINFEKNLDLENLKVKITNERIKQFFSNDFNSYLDNRQKNSFSEWYEKECKTFRHSLCHRIPLYVPPSYIFDYEEYMKLENKKLESLKNKKQKQAKKIEKEQLKFCHNYPFFTHSFCEKAPRVNIHTQIIKNSSMIIEFINKFFDGTNL